MAARKQRNGEAVATGDDGRGGFVAGDRVRVGGIGPEMVTVEFCDGSNGGPAPFIVPPPPGWIVAWFVQGALRQATFPAEVLRRVEPKADA